MRLLQRQASTPSPQDSSPVSEPGLLDSRLLQEVFAGVEAGERLSVLDLGSGNAGTVNFLSSYNAKIHFIDLPDTVVHHPELLRADDATQLMTNLQSVLRLPDGLQFDVVLVWDILHQLQPMALDCLSNLIFQHTHAASRGYGFGVVQGAQAQERHGGAYGIDTIASLRHSPDPTRTFVPYTQKKLSEHFPALRIARATMLKNGQLELLLQR